MNCPLCQRESKSHVERQSYVFRRCEPCRHVYLDHQPLQDHVEQVYDDSYFFGGGAGYDDYLEQREVVRERGQFYERKLREFMSPGRLLDIGSGAGFFASAFADAGWKVSGLEPNSRMAEFANEQSRVPTKCGTVEDFSSAEPFDAIVAIQVAAHFVDPVKALERCFGALRPGGYLLVETWNSDSVTAGLLKASWHEYSPPSILHCFSKCSMDRLAARCGFDSIRQRTTLKKIRARHAKSLLRAKGEHSLVCRLALAAASVIPDRLSLYYPADDLFWSLYQRPLMEEVVQKKGTPIRAVAPQPAVSHV
jgi:2-polyprenyl-3-methyl-5-hydroxy-6-metoxy-1,4-benzoquinol methylase